MIGTQPVCDGGPAFFFSEFGGPVGPNYRRRRNSGRFVTDKFGDESFPVDRVVVAYFTEVCDRTQHARRARDVSTTPIDFGTRKNKKKYLEKKKRKLAAPVSPGRRCCRRQRFRSAAVLSSRGRTRYYMPTTHTRAKASLHVLIVHQRQCHTRE